MRLRSILSLNRPKYLGVETEHPGKDFETNLDTPAPMGLDSKAGTEPKH